MPATRWRYNKGKGVLGFNFRTESPTVKNFISTDAHKSAASFEIGHAHLRIYTFFATSQKLCQSPKHTPPRVFARFGRNQKHYALPTPTSKSWSNNCSTTIGRPNGSALKICTLATLYQTAPKSITIHPINTKLSLVLLFP